MSSGPKEGACYRCLYPEPPPPGLVPSCAEGGVLGVLPGIVGTIQANEVIKVILGAEGILLNRLLLFDAWKMTFRQLKLRKDPNCPVCGDNPTIKELIDYEEFCGLNTRTEEETVLEEITATELNELLDKQRRTATYRRPRAARVRDRTAFRVRSLSRSARSLHAPPRSTRHAPPSSSAKAASEAQRPSPTSVPPASPAA